VVRVVEVWELSREPTSAVCCIGLLSDARQHVFSRALVSEGTVVSRAASAVTYHAPTNTLWWGDYPNRLVYGYMPSSIGRLVQTAAL